MTELVDDLLDVSRVTSGLVKLEQEALDLHDVAAGAVEQVRSLIDARGHRLRLNAPDEPLTVLGDRTRLIQVLANLLNNSSKYTPDGGDISLTMASENRMVRISVRDNGIGIDPKLLPNIFDLFTQAERSPDRSQGGLGLGLALVRSLVDLHGGHVGARSDGPGTGSEFTVCLPRLDHISSIDAPRHQGAQPSLTHNGMRVLVVDDNVDAAESLALLLQVEGHQVSVGHSARDALRLAQTEAPQVFLLDIGLPDMDGYELARRLRATEGSANAILIALTGYGQEQDQQRSKDAGFNHHLVKPAGALEVSTLLAELATQV
jgi:CheY-like chemotaxis protein